MKKIALWLVLAVLALSLTACNANPQSAASTRDVPLKELVQKHVSAAESMIQLPRTDLEDVIGIDLADLTDAVYLQDEGMGGNEALVVRAADEKAAERIAALLEGYLEQRRKETRNYVPEAYQLLEKAKVERKNLTIVLLSGEKAAEETKALLAGE